MNSKEFLPFVIGITILALIVLGLLFYSRYDSTVSEEKNWTEVYRFSGTDNKETDTFTLTENKVRISYKIECDRCYAPYFSVHLVDEDTRDIPAIFGLEAEGNDSTIARIVPDNYYFRIYASNLEGWEIIVEELR